MQKDYVSAWRRSSIETANIIEAKQIKQTRKMKLIE